MIKAKKAEITGIKKDKGKAIKMKTDIIACPFCHVGEVEVMVFGGVWQEKRTSTATFGSTRSRRKSATNYVVQTDCPRCGKTADEIEKML